MLSHRFLGVFNFIAAVATITCCTSASAAVIVNGESTWPTTPAVQTTADPDLPGAERGTGANRNEVQTFQVPTAFKIDKIFLGYQNGIENDTFNLRIFTVDDVNATIDVFFTPEDPNYTGSILLNEPVALTGPIQAGNITSVLEFDLTDTSQIILPATTGTAGYAFQIFGDADANAIAWQITTATQASIYAEGKLFELPTGGAKNDFGGRDASLAFSAVLVPGDFDGDGDVDGADFVAWQTNFPKESGALLAQGDADADGDVDGADFVVWQTNFPFPASPGATPVPEPTAGYLAALSAIALISQRRPFRWSGFSA